MFIDPEDAMFTRSDLERVIQVYQQTGDADKAVLQIMREKLGNPDDGQVAVSEQDAEAAQNYMRANGINDWRHAVKYVRGRQRDQQAVQYARQRESWDRYVRAAYNLQ